METDETDRVLPFQLQFDKPVASQVKIAEWNPEKDLLAMVTEESKILLHRFNWQRLWTISPGRNITSLCWRPDGKAIAVGLEDGTISLHDVENGKLLRSLKSHTVAVVCLNWEEEGQVIRDDSNNFSAYEDRTSHFFPPAPRVPRMPGVVSGDTSFMDDSEDSYRELKNELHQLAQQASNIEDLTEVIRASLSVMCKQWSDAMRTFHEKFNSLSTLIIDHALDSSPQEEFLSLLGGARTSPAVHQFLVNSLGEVGVKRVLKVVCGTAKELQHIVLDHLQPAAEIIGFRMGELRGLSRWRARYHGIGLDEMLINNATEKSGMILVQIERFMRVLSSVEQQFSNFFNWLLKCIKLLMQEPSDQLLPYNSELVVIFLKFLYDQDPVKQLLEVDHDIEVDLETMQRVKELVQFGGFSDCEYLQRTLAKEFQQMEDSFKEAFLMPFTTISRKMLCEDLLPLFPLPSSPASDSQIVLLLNGASASSESSGDACMMTVQASELPFISISRFTDLNLWNLHQLKDSAVRLEMENETVRNIPHSVIAPLAVSASRGVACVFAARKRALVYILEEDEEEVPDTE
ncbi:unnamed protein product [Dovyalis caffra]|uniref:Anaphase-promoting complex subunit 4 n=1 Tax=Dovyalis caffra TaxID=77055 RepID=A0AAV1SJV0_9ROSI|nr:unnamed protein product [Dovyalis caffra]